MLIILYQLVIRSEAARPAQFGQTKFIAQVFNELLNVGDVNINTFQCEE